MDTTGTNSRIVKSKEGTDAKHQKELKKTCEKLGLTNVPSVPPRPILPPVAYERTPKMCPQQSYENETIMSYRNQLSILVASGNCQKFLGKNLTF